MVDRFERFLMSISEIEYSWHKIAGDILQEYGLKGAYASYLTMLYRFPEGVSSAQLAERCRKDKADVSRAVSEFEKKGFVCREGRVSYRAKVLLTAEGRALAEMVNRKARIAVTLGGEGLSEAERAAFQYALDRIAGNLSLLARDGLPDTAEGMNEK